MLVKHKKSFNMSKINKIRFNFVQVMDGNEAGESYEEITLGKFWYGVKSEKVDKENTVTSIGLGKDADGKTFYHVQFKKGEQIKIYNPNLVFYSK